MKKLLVSAFLSFLLFVPFASAHAGYVNGYYRSNGTYVQGYYRADPVRAVSAAAPAAKPVLKVATPVVKKVVVTSATYYTNVNNIQVQSPSISGSAGATAKCRDMTYSHSTHRSGTCSGHGGVATWF
ncbi:MAG: hypothetical protein JWN49_683 [Parcubacteria group bacterium]|nr:hypothetical protein [Parcubacteria group bacterium]